MLCFFFFNDTATTEIYTLSLHDALPIYHRACRQPVPIADLERVRRTAAGEPTGPGPDHQLGPELLCLAGGAGRDRKSTRLNSSHLVISYAVFCLKKKK